MSLVEKKRQAKANKVKPTVVEVKNTSAAEVASLFSESLMQSQQVIQTLFNEQIKVLKDLQTTMQKQNEQLAKALDKPVKVEAGVNKINMPPRVGSFKVIYDEDGRVDALVAHETITH